MILEKKTKSYKTRQTNSPEGYITKQQHLGHQTVVSLKSRLLDLFLLSAEKIITFVFLFAQTTK